MRFFVFCFLIFGVYSVHGDAASTAPVGAAANDKVINQVQSYFDSLKDFRAALHQITLNGPQKGTQMSGHLLLKRPQKARIEYISPSQILMVAGPKSIAYWDVSLDQVSYVNTGDTPLSFLLGARIDLKKNFVVTQAKSEVGKISLSLHQANKPLLGRMTLEFKENPMQLVAWTLVDAQGTQIRVELTHMSSKPFTAKEFEEFFVFKNPRIYGKKSYESFPKWYQ